jgi:hypothetical protein
MAQPDSPRPSMWRRRAVLSFWRSRYDDDPPPTQDEPGSVVNGFAVA